VNWKCHVPMAMDTGKGNRWACKKLSEGFGEDKKPRTQFFLFKEQIKKQ